MRYNVVMVQYDLRQRVFGKLTVLEYDKKSVKWLCQCSCGKKKLIKSWHLRKAGVRSCGCISGKLISKAKTTHGMRRTRFYCIWSGMIYRCKYDKNYSGRGIKVCKRWEKFSNFYDDMFSTYKQDLSIDRIDNDGNYEPSNCRWADALTQAGNKRNNVLFNGETARQASLRLGGCEAMVSMRIRKGWNREKAFNTPVRK